ncbi:nicotinamide mononucleotide transporter PnuC, partial [Tetzosporium hominis]
VPLILEFTQNTESHDWLSLFASWTGIVCVILVAEGRASNYLFGTINSAIYLILAMNATFYGEVLTTVYFFVMQPIGLYAWLSNRINEQEKPEESHFEAKK